MHGKFKRILLFTMAGLFILPSFLNVVLPPPSAYAAQTNPADQLDRWLYYKGMRACFEKPWFDDGTGGVSFDDNATISASDINEGHLSIDDWEEGFAKKEGFGYLAGGSDGLDGGDGDDGTVSCHDGSIFVRGASAFGFPSVVHLICAMNKALSLDELDEGGRIKPSDGTVCVNSSEFYFDGGDSVFQQALTKALEDPIASDYGGDGDRPLSDLPNNDGPDYDAKALYYLLGKRSLETFCGDGKSLESASVDNKSYKDSNDVVSVDVVNADGTIKKSQSYPISNTDRTEGSTVNDVYYKNGGNPNEADNVKCYKMAEWTRDNSQAYADWAKKHPEEAGQNASPSDPSSDNPSEDEETSCAIDGIGWLICPVVRLVARITDASYTVVSAMLTVQPLSTNSSSDTYKAWEVMRNIANICFVIAFLIIIYSQISGAGVGNYGIKKMLPRIIIAALLVNLSYWICAVAVDLSNILGTSIKGLVDGLNANLLDENAQQGNSVWSQLAAVVLVAGVALFVGLSAFLPMVILAVMAVVTVLLVLTLRQGLIILLIVIAPLAFVAYLLPNTEDWFKKWMGLFKILLLMFPIIALIFAASSLAGTIIGNSANDIDNEGIKIAVQAMAAGVTIIPLFITPIVLKAAGGLLGKVGAFVNNPNRGPFDRMRKGAEGYRGRRKNMMQSRRLGRASGTLSGEGGVLGGAYSRRRKVAGFIRGSGASRAVNAAEKDKYAEIGANAAKRDYIADRALGDDSYAKNIGGSAMASDIIAYAQQAKKEEKAKDIAAAAATMAGLSNDQISQMTTSGKRVMPDGSRKDLTKEEHAAAMYRIMETGSFKERNKALEYVASNKGSFSADVRNEIVQKSIARGDSNIYGAGFGNQIVEEGGSINSGATLAAAAANNAAAGKVSAEHLVQNGASTKYLIDSAQGNAAALGALKTAAAAARTQPGTASKVTGEFDSEFKRL